MTIQNPVPNMFSDEMTERINEAQIAKAVIVLVRISSDRLLT